MQQIQINLTDVLVSTFWHNRFNKQFLVRFKKNPVVVLYKSENFGILSNWHKLAKGVGNLVCADICLDFLKRTKLLSVY